MSPEYFDPLVDENFQKADLNQNGKIEKTELAVLLKEIHAAMQIPAPTQKQILAELKRLDTNKDSVISKDEFRVLVKDLVLFSIEQM